VTRRLIDDFGVNKEITTASCNDINPRYLALRPAGLDSLRYLHGRVL
jgi:hypothetical protein